MRPMAAEMFRPRRKMHHKYLIRRSSYEHQGILYEHGNENMHRTVVLNQRVVADFKWVMLMGLNFLITMEDGINRHWLKNFIIKSRIGPKTVVIKLFYKNDV